MKKTNFYKTHEKAGAKIVEFAGYKMPIQYKSIIAEHKAVRNSVGAFDVSHMGEVMVSGEKALDFVQNISTNNAEKLFPGRVQYSAMCYEDGGIVDDMLVYQLEENKYMLVINASNIEKDFEWMQKNNPMNAELSNQSDEYSLIAVQGPESRKVVEKFLGKEIDTDYYHFFNAKYKDVDMIVSRTGYTGELGFEIYFKSDEDTALEIWDGIFAAGAEYGIEPAGLAARDSLRLEMGFCLYGNDIDKTTNPIEANLGWITKVKKGDFIGRDVLAKAKQEGVSRKLTAMTAEGKGIPRQGYDILKDGKKVGSVTSGTMSPILEKGIALGYVETELSNEGQELTIDVRGRELPVKVVKLPFVKSGSN